MCQIYIVSWSGCDHHLQEITYCDAARKAKRRSKRKQKWFGCMYVPSSAHPCKNIKADGEVDPYPCSDCQSRKERAQREARRQQAVRRQAETERAEKEEREYIARVEKEDRERIARAEAKKREARQRLEAQELELILKRAAQEQAREAAIGYGWETSRESQGRAHVDSYIENNLYQHCFDAYDLEYAAYVPAPLNIRKTANIATRRGNRTPPTIQVPAPSPGPTPIQVPPETPPAKAPTPDMTSRQARDRARARGEKAYDPKAGVELVVGEDGREYGVIGKGKGKLLCPRVSSPLGPPPPTPPPPPAPTAAQARAQARAAGKKVYDPKTGVELVIGKDGREYGVIGKGKGIELFPKIDTPAKVSAPSPSMKDYVLNFKGEYVLDSKGKRIRKQGFVKTPTTPNFVKDGCAYWVDEQGRSTYVGPVSKFPSLCKQKKDESTAKVTPKYVPPPHSVPYRPLPLRAVEASRPRQQTPVEKTPVQHRAVKERPVHEIARDYGSNIPSYRQQKHETSDEYGEPLPSDDFLDDLRTRRYVDYVLSHSDC